MKFSRIILLFVFTLLFSISIYSQDDKNDSKIEGYGKTLMQKSDELTYGYYISTTLGYSNINKENAFVSGGKAVFLIDHKWGIGLQSSNTIGKPFDLEGTTEKGIYIGHSLSFLLEPIFYSERVLSISVPLTIGREKLTKRYKNDDWSKNKDDIIDSVNLLKLSLGVEFDLHVIKWGKIGFGAYYNYRSDLEQENTLDFGILSDFSVGVNLKFGKF